MEEDQTKNDKTKNIAKEEPAAANNQESSTMEEPAAAANTHITFDQTPSTEFYMCSNLTCRTHVLFSDNVLYKDRKLQGINCANPVNVTAPDDERYWTAFEGHDAVEVYCNGCNRSLGYKFGSVAVLEW